MQRAQEILSAFPGIKVIDNPEKLEYPLPLFAEGKDEVFVGRIREDISTENGLVMWVVSDNLRKGAALNAVQIVEQIIERELYHIKKKWQNIFIKKEDFHIFCSIT